MPASRDHFDKFFLTLTYFYYEILILIMLQCINEKPCFHHNLILAPLAPLKSSMCSGEQTEVNFNHTPSPHIMQFPLAQFPLAYVRTSWAIPH